MNPQVSGKWGVSDRAAALHAQAVVCDWVLPWTDFSIPGIKLRGLDTAAAAGYNLVSLTLSGDRSTADQTCSIIARERNYFLKRPDKFLLIETVDDIHRAKREGRLGIAFNFQGTDPFKRDLNYVELYYKLGIRHALLAYNQKNAVGDGCHERTDGGLSTFGIALIEEMNRVGMIVDVSHTGYRTSMDALEMAKTPVIFSHSNPHALFPHQRNIKDDQILACARTGGVVGVNGMSTFLGDDTSSANVVRTVLYLVERVGADHVGLGLDFVQDRDGLIKWMQGMGPSRFPSGSGYEKESLAFVSPSQAPQITEGLLDAGLSDGEVLKILGQNWIRVAKEVWA